MLGLSLSKIIFTVLVIVAVWKGWRLMETLRDKISDPEDYVKAPKPRRSKAPKAAETLYECPHCHTYVPNGTICRSKEQCVLRQD
jgi:ribosomal protein L32